MTALPAAAHPTRDDDTRLDAGTDTTDTEGGAVMGQHEHLCVPIRYWFRRQCPRRPRRHRGGLMYAHVVPFTPITERISPMFRKFLIAFLVATFTLLSNPAPAMADHSGPYIANRTYQTTVDVIIRDHDSGTRFWQYVPAGRNSLRGATGVFVYYYNKILYRSIATGALYTSGCGREYQRLGYTFTGKPYMPVPSDRSLEIIDVYYASECYW